MYRVTGKGISESERHHSGIITIKGRTMSLYIYVYAWDFQKKEKSSSRHAAKDKTLEAIMKIRREKGIIDRHDQIGI